MKVIAIAIYCRLQVWEKIEMWTPERHELSGIDAFRFTFEFNSKPATYADVFKGWQDDLAFCDLFNALLGECPYNAFRWEIPGLIADAISEPFECVVLNSPGLERHPDPEAFAEHFARSAADVAVFLNLGGDAILIVPFPIAEPSAYGHLAAFVRRAPASQTQSFWKSVGKALAARIGHQPIWLSTAGAGVPWLHARLDNRPKYYVYEPYRKVVSTKG